MILNNSIDFAEDRFTIYENLVKNSFSFLEEDYGFKLSEIKRENKSHIVLVFLSENIFVNLYYGAPDFELDFYIGRIGIEDEKDKGEINSNDLISFSAAPESLDYKLYSAHSYENLHKCLPKLAELLRAYGADFLRGKSSIYEKVLFNKKKKISRWYKEQDLKQAKKAASAAWGKKDYKEFIDICEIFSHTLSPSDEKKLDYARKHL